MSDWILKTIHVKLEGVRGMKLVDCAQQRIIKIRQNVTQEIIAVVMPLWHQMYNIGISVISEVQQTVTLFAGRPQVISLNVQSDDCQLPECNYAQWLHFVHRKHSEHAGTWFIGLPNCAKRSLAFAAHWLPNFWFRKCRMVEDHVQILGNANKEYVRNFVKDWRADIVNMHRIFYDEWAG